MLTSKFVLATSLALATAGAFADSGDIHINDWSTFSSTVTSASYASGERAEGERGYVFAEYASTPRSRAEVQAELQEASRLGLVSVGEGDMPIATAEQEQLIAKAGQDASHQLAKSSDDVEG
jgi:hypothetical protein